MRVNPVQNMLLDSKTGLYTRRPGQELGRYGRGNIDLYNRPQYMQPDGSVSTVNSMSFGDEAGKEILVPTIGYDANGNPVQMDDQQAIDNYYDTGEYLGKFDDWRDADAYAEALHNQQSKYYDTNSKNILYELARMMYGGR